MSWFFTKLGVCIHVVEIKFGIVNGQILSIFDKSYLPTICPSFNFWMITLVSVNGFFPNLVCALILWRSDLGLLMGKFRQFLTELSARYMSVFSFLDDNFSKCQWIFTRLGICIALILLSALRLIMGKSIIFGRVICPQYIHILFTGQ